MKKKQNKSQKSPKKVHPPITLSRFSFASIILILISAAFLAGTVFTKFQSGTLLGNNNETIVEFEPPKEALSTMKFFTMSFCPYGNQAETSLAPVAKLLGEDGKIEVHYIFSKIDDIQSFCQDRIYNQQACQQYVDQGYFASLADCRTRFVSSIAECKNKYLLEKNGIAYSSLHGRGELNQNIREICAARQETNPQAWWDFVLSINTNCDSENVDSCWEPLAKKAGFDTEAIKLCFNKEAVAIIESEIAESEKYQAFGSPTFIVNGENFPPKELYDTQTGQAEVQPILKIGKEKYDLKSLRTPETLKQAVCAGMKKQSKTCKEKLEEASTTSAAGGC